MILPTYFVKWHKVLGLRRHTTPLWEKFLQQIKSLPYGDNDDDEGECDGDDDENAH